MRVGFLLLLFCFSATVNAAPAMTNQAEDDVINFTRFITRLYSYYLKLPIPKEGTKSLLKSEFEQLKRTREKYKEIQDACMKAPFIYSVRGGAYKTQGILQYRETPREDFSALFAQKNLKLELLRNIRAERQLLNSNLPSSSFLENLIAKFVGIKDPKNLRENVLAYVDSISSDIKNDYYNRCSIKIGNILIASKGLGK